MRRTADDLRSACNSVMRFQRAVAAAACFWPLGGFGRVDLGLTVERASRGGVAKFGTAAGLDEHGAKLGEALAASHH